MNELNQQYSYVLGKTIKEAMDLGIREIAVISVDGKPCAVTADLIFDRLNVVIKNGIIVNICHLG